MTPRALLSAAMADRVAFDAIAVSAEPGTFPEELIPIWKGVQKYYELSPEATSADVDTVVAYSVDGMSNPKHRKITEEAVREIGQTSSQGKNPQELVRLAALARIRNELAVGLGSRKEYEEIEPLILQYQSLSIPEADDPELSWNGIVGRRADPKSRMRVSPRALNSMLGGGLLPGHNITLFGLTETGKSALALTMAVGFAKRGIKVLYVINEDSVQDLMLRAISCITGLPFEDMEANPEMAENEAIRLGIGNLVMRELSPGSLPELEKLVKSHKPKVLVVDQLRNLKGAKTGTYTELLDKMAQGVRAIGKRHKIVTISVTQGADSARDKAYLDTGDIDSSNVGIPGAADVLIGVGVNSALYSANQRMLTVCKNKVTGKHGSVTVNIRPEISRFTTGDN